MKKLIIVSVFSMFVATVWATNTYTATGAKAIGIGQSAVNFQDLWAIMNNQAGMAFLSRPTLGVSYEERFHMKELSLKTVAFVLPTNRVGNFGVSYTHFGDSAYSESRINLGYARKLGDHFAMGLAFDYLAISVEGSAEVGTADAFTAELGIMGEPVQNLWLSLHTYNPFGVTIRNYEYEEKLPTLFRLGALYHFSEELLAVVELEKDVDYKARFKAGVEYVFMDKFVFRTGIATNPTEYSGGVGILLKKLKIQFAFYKHQYLGYTPSVAISYSF